MFAGQWQGPFKGERGGQYWISPSGEKDYDYDPNKTREAASNEAKKEIPAEPVFEGDSAKLILPDNPTVDNVATAIEKQLISAGYAVRTHIARTGSTYLRVSDADGNEYRIRVADHANTTKNPDVINSGRYADADFKITVKPDGTIKGWDDDFAKWPAVTAQEWRAAVGSTSPDDLYDWDKKAYLAALAREAKRSNHSEKIGDKESFASSRKKNIGRLVVAKLPSAETLSLQEFTRRFGELQTFAADDWDGPHEGERGGTYWINRKSGERTYEDPTQGGDSDGSASSGSVQASQAWQQSAQAQGIDAPTSRALHSGLRSIASESDPEKQASRLKSFAASITMLPVNAVKPIVQSLFEFGKRALKAGIRVVGAVGLHLGGIAVAAGIIAASTLIPGLLPASIPAWSALAAALPIGVGIKKLLTATSKASSRVLREPNTPGVSYGNA